ncbi:hypothetical protein AAH979_37255 [Plantactinospora sp. ZYX-F-223]|uniref:hypothetical protein n=1 Tax=Plantactinospora sp. ZYX-F-223 TaxID=3144103 RepID=UPI0031FD5620
MFHARLRLPLPVPAGYAPEIERMLFFVSSTITGFNLVVCDGQVVEISLTSDQPIEEDRLLGRVVRLLGDEIYASNVAPRKVVWESPAHRDVPGDSFEQLVSMGAAVRLGVGQVGVGEPMLSLMGYLDSLLRDLVVREFGAVEYRYPTLISTDVVSRCGYFESFPHFLMFVTRLHEDTDVYRTVASRFRDGRSADRSILADCDNVDYCLPPTMCFHTFNQLQGQRLAPDESRVVTARGKSFRHESRYANTLERLWDFTIREIVFIGSRDDVLQSRQRIMDLVFAEVSELGLMGVCEVANDPFFRNGVTSGRILSQRLLELKYELRMNVSADRTVAVGSFNFHNTFFSDTFDIRHGDGSAASTGCVGFGIERMAYAFICQYGTDPARWPARVRSAVTAGNGAAVR